MLLFFSTLKIRLLLPPLLALPALFLILVLILSLSPSCRRKKSALKIVSGGLFFLFLFGDEMPAASWPLKNAAAQSTCLGIARAA